MKGLAVALGGIALTQSRDRVLFHSPRCSGPANPAPRHLQRLLSLPAARPDLGGERGPDLAANADAYVVGRTSATPRYSTWFGTYTSGRKNTVSAHFRSMSQTKFNALIYDCTCQQAAKFGYVNPAEADHVFLCQSFWNAPTTGTDSKAGTLINLVGQFSKNGGLKDSAQGQAGCKTLATNNPDAAAMNAASYEYFAENNPPLN